MCSITNPYHLLALIVHAFYSSISHFLSQGELSMRKGVKYQLAPGDDGVYGNEDDVKDGWLLVMDLRSGESGFVPVDYVKQISTPAPRGASTPKRAMAPNPVVVVNGKVESIRLREHSAVSPALSLQDLAGDMSELGSSAPVRRLSDPRLQQKLLASIDESAAMSASQRKASARETSARKASSRKTSSRTPTVKISTPTTPTSSSTTPTSGRKSSRALVSPRVVGNIVGE